ncbi:MAG: aldehyde ferredoxin oxidoreductase family protein [Candidatus Korarchaeota archaeon]
MLSNDPLKRILFIDLSNKSFWIEERPELFNKWIGGTGVGIQLLKENVPPGADPLGPENAIVLAVGPLNGIFPMASKTVAMFKSPLTGNLGESHAGGRSAVAIRLAGYGAVVIKGKSSIPVYLTISENTVHFRDARSLWGIPSSRPPRWAIAKREPGSGFRTIMVIGPAGERMVRYATVVTETFRHFGRLGLGAVFGSKNLKAIQIGGKRSFEVRDKLQYKKMYADILKRCLDPEFVSKYRDLGTASNVLPLNELNALPVMNLKIAKLENAETISGEYLAKNYLGKRIACSLCPVGCVHLAALREVYPHARYFYKTTLVSYDYEPIYALGSMLGVTDTEGMLKLLNAVENLGLDAMSTGVALAWATEALERGIISEKETIVKLKWGDAEKYLDAVYNLTYQTNDFYGALARGVAFASSIYGGGDFALTFGGNEMPGYHTGPAAHMSFLYGARHSHLDSAGYVLDQKMFSKGRIPSPEEITDYIINEESWRQILTSLVVCLFARKIYDEEVVVNALDILSFSMTAEELKKRGREIYIEKFRYKIAEGFSIENVKIPKRIFETPSPFGKIEPELFEKARKLFQSRLSEMLKTQ